VPLLSGVLPGSPHRRKVAFEMLDARCRLAVALTGRLDCGGMNAVVAALRPHDSSTYVLASLPYKSVNLILFIYFPLLQHSWRFSLDQWVVSVLFSLITETPLREASTINNSLAPRETDCLVFFY
jgi:hypothetical protein